MRISDRVFGHALRLRNSAIPRSTGSFISQLRELEQIREMITSSTLATIVDLPFFFLFMIVLAIIAPPLAWIAPVAALLMILPGVALQKTGCPRQPGRPRSDATQCSLGRKRSGAGRY